ncbi:MAG: response regulator transcription factor [Lachnospiraceae bacterium]|nr:response regulator transcription factor [Lachnospiraceae bacterium]
MIFCVEDDEGIRELMIYALGSAGFSAKGFSDGVSFFEALEREKPELVLLDIMLPGEDGISILKRLRSGEAAAKVPVIMASAKGTEYDKVIGLDLGADDYLAKPFGMMEMVSRVRAVLRRTSGESGTGDAGRETEECFQMGALVMDRAGHRVSVCGNRVALTLKEYELLRLFMEHPGRVFTRDQLLCQVWGFGYEGETRTVDVHIGTLRTKLGECGGYIETVRGVGYRMERIE